MQQLTLTRRALLEHSPFVGELAERIAESFNQFGDSEWSKKWPLIEKVLTFAADAEQRIAEQQTRIAYLEALSNTDELTGLANRRGFEAFLLRSLDLARRHDEWGMVAYLDLDDFKAVNDSWGHPAGDRMLQRVADILSRNVRLSDYVARLGGDEFAVILVRADREQAEQRVRLLRELVNGSKIKVGRNCVRIRASIGAALFGPDSDAGDLIHRADRAMYREKERRRRKAH